MGFKYRIGENVTYKGQRGVIMKRYQYVFKSEQDNFEYDVKFCIDKISLPIVAKNVMEKNIH